MKTQILLGTLLGDGSIAKLKGKNRSLSVRWEHSMYQKDYAIWKANNSLDNYSIYKRNRLDPRTNKIYSSITCYSIKDDYKSYRNLFYKEKKEVSDIILEKLEPLGVAVWFMDDGNLYYNGNNCHLTLSINGFNDNSRNLIINYFKNKYNIIFKKSGKAIRITSVKQVRLWESFFLKYYHESMIYKSLDYQREIYNNKLTDEQKKYRRKDYR